MFHTVEFADEVTEDYLKKALKFSYKGRTYTDKFSDKLLRVLLSDYKKKMKNLAWFFKDENGRIRNYVEILSNPKDALNNAQANNSQIRDLVKALKIIGATYTPEQFFKNRCIVQKQEMKISKAITERDRKTPFDLEVYNNQSCKVFYKGKPLEDVPLRAHAWGMVVYKDYSYLMLDNVIMADDLKLEVSDRFTGYSATNIIDVINNGAPSNFVISMDLADIITCSTGNCRSCLSVDNIHSAGAIQSFRSEFSVITFTHGADRHSKLGRSWLMLRVTERGHLRDLPFWKQQKSYGSVNSTHQNALHTLIKEKASALTTASFTPQDMWDSYMVSTNVHTGAISGHSHTSAPGYIDTASSGIRAFYVLRDKADKYRHAAEILLPFDDMVDLKGEISNITSFHTTRNQTGFFGAATGNIFEVTCSITNTIVLDTDAVEIDGRWIRKDILPQLLAGKDSASVTLEAAVETPVEVEEVYEEVNVDDF